MSTPQPLPDQPEDANALLQDALTPREALDALYRLKAFCPVQQGNPELPSP